jgi:hypothetical protein
MSGNAASVTQRKDSNNVSVNAVVVVGAQTAFPGKQ